MAKRTNPKKFPKTPGRSTILKEIAEQIRAIPGMNLRTSLDVEKMAGRLLADALKHRAFARIKHAPLRTWVDEQIENGHYGVAFDSMVYWLRKYEPNSLVVTKYPKADPPLHVNDCLLLADVLESEADVPEAEQVLDPPVPGRLEAVAKEEAIQRRQERKRSADHILDFYALSHRKAGMESPQTPTSYVGIRPHGIRHQLQIKLDPGAKNPPLDPDKPDVELDAERLRVRVKGKWYDLTDEQNSMLAVLIDAKGAWVQGPNLGVRPDKKIATMPNAVQGIIESHQRQGYRITSLLPK